MSALCDVAIRPAGMHCIYAQYNCITLLLAMKPTLLRTQAKRMLAKRQPPRSVLVISGHISKLHDLTFRAEADNPTAIIIAVRKFVDGYGTCSTD